MIENEMYFDVRNSEFLRFVEKNEGLSVFIVVSPVNEPILKIQKGAKKKVLQYIFRVNTGLLVPIKKQAK